MLSRANYGLFIASKAVIANSKSWELSIATERITSGRRRSKAEKAGAT